MKCVLGFILIALSVASAACAQRSTAAPELIALENAWKESVINRDALALNRLYADEYLSIDQEGMIWNKSEDIDIDTKGLSRLTSYKLDDMKVRLYGDVAVVTGLNTSQGTFSGRPASSRSRFTDVFVKRDGRWQCVTSQSTAIAK